MMHHRSRPLLGSRRGGGGGPLRNPFRGGGGALTYSDPRYSSGQRAGGAPSPRNAARAFLASPCRCLILAATIAYLTYSSFFVETQAKAPAAATGKTTTSTTASAAAAIPVAPTEEEADATFHGRPYVGGDGEDSEIGGSPIPEAEGPERQVDGAAAVAGGGGSRDPPPSTRDGDDEGKDDETAARRQKGEGGDEGDGRSPEGDDGNEGEGDDNQIEQFDDEESDEANGGEGGAGKQGVEASQSGEGATAPADTVEEAMAAATTTAAHGTDWTTDSQLGSGETVDDDRAEGPPSSAEEEVPSQPQDDESLEAGGAAYAGGTGGADERPEGLGLAADASGDNTGAHVPDDGIEKLPPPSESEAVEIDAKPIGDEAPGKAERDEPEGADAAATPGSDSSIEPPAEPLEIGGGEETASTGEGSDEESADEPELGSPEGAPADFRDGNDVAEDGKEAAAGEAETEATPETEAAASDQLDTTPASQAGALTQDAGLAKEEVASSEAFRGAWKQDKVRIGRLGGDGGEEDPVEGAPVDTPPVGGDPAAPKPEGPAASNAGEVSPPLVDALHKAMESEGESESDAHVVPESDSDGTAANAETATASADAGETLKEHSAPKEDAGTAESKLPEDATTNEVVEISAGEGEEEKESRAKSDYKKEESVTGSSVQLKEARRDNGDLDTDSLGEQNPVKKAKTKEKSSSASHGAPEVDTKDSARSKNDKQSAEPATDNNADPVGSEEKKRSTVNGNEKDKKDSAEDAAGRSKKYPIESDAKDIAAVDPATDSANEEQKMGKSDNGTHSKNTVDELEDPVKSEKDRTEEGKTKKSKKDSKTKDEDLTVKKKLSERVTASHDAEPSKKSKRSKVTNSKLKAEKDDPSLVASDAKVERDGKESKTKPEDSDGDAEVSEKNDSKEEAKSRLRGSAVEKSKRRQRD